MLIITTLRIAALRKTMAETCSFYRGAVAFCCTREGRNLSPFWGKKPFARVNQKPQWVHLHFNQHTTYWFSLQLCSIVFICISALLCRILNLPSSSGGSSEKCFWFPLRVRGQEAIAYDFEPIARPNLWTISAFLCLTSFWGSFTAQLHCRELWWWWEMHGLCNTECGSRVLVCNGCIVLLENVWIPPCGSSISHWSKENLLERNCWFSHSRNC